MHDEKQASQTESLERNFNSGSIEKATAELRLDTYRQSRNYFLILFLFSAYYVINGQQSKFHKEQELIRHTILHSTVASLSEKDIESKDFDSARRLKAYQVLLAESERKFGSDSTLLIPVLSKLAALNTELDRLPEAEALYMRCQALIQKYNQEQSESPRK